MPTIKVNFVDQEARDKLNQVIEQTNALEKQMNDLHEEVHHADPAN